MSEVDEGSVGMAGIRRRFDPHAYTIAIRRVVLDGQEVFHGRVVELPDLEAFEPTQEAAYDFLIDGIETSKEAFDEQGREFPSPLPAETPEYSGRVTLRLPRWLHQRLDYSAQLDGTSLNQYLVSILAYAASPGSNLSLSNRTAQAAVHHLQEIPAVRMVGLESIGAAFTEQLYGPLDVAEMHAAASKVEAAMRIQNVPAQLSRPTIKVTGTLRPDYGPWRSSLGIKPGKAAAIKKKA